MAKAWEQYQELVGSVQRALDPGATVEVGTWVEGPDGRRDMDVSVRGTKDGRDFFVLIECKYHQRPVGIRVIDELKSKREDLKADRAIIFSNSGFTRDAARKARRVGIDLASALREGDPLVNVEIVRTFVAKAYFVVRWVMVLFLDSTRTEQVDFHPFDISYDGLPVVNWIEGDSLRLLREHPDSRVIKAEYAFKGEQDFVIREQKSRLTGLAYQLECETNWVAQRVRENVTLGSYDFLTGQISVPDQETYGIGPFDRYGWRPCSAPDDGTDLEPGTFRHAITLLTPVHGIAGAGVPDLNMIIKERLVTTSE